MTRGEQAVQAEQAGPGPSPSNVGSAGNGGEMKGKAIQTFS